MALSPADYMAVQQLYAGWSFFGVVIILALLATLAHSIAVRDNRMPR